MKKYIQRNKGFTLIELLIAMAILSIIMLMVIMFMSTTTRAYRKTRKNVEVQTESVQVMEQISDTLMQADFVRVEAEDDEVYILEADSTKKGDEARKFVNVLDTTPDAQYKKSDRPAMKQEKYDENLQMLKYAYSTFEDAKKKNQESEDAGSDARFSYSFVPDNYPNYVKPAANDERKIIINYENFQLINNKNIAYPISGDKEYVDDTSGQWLRSFQLLKPVEDWEYCYIKPKYIYVEYSSKDSAGTLERVHVAYYIKDNKIYMARKHGCTATDTYSSAIAEVTSLANAGGSKGLLTSMIKDFYMSADAAGNCLLPNVMFKNDSYVYNYSVAINFRNSNVLSVRPQNLYKKVIKKKVPSTTADSTADGGGTPVPDTP